MNQGMARPIPPERFAQLVDVATRTFIARGYRMTQMADVAEGLGVAKGTVYLYVESKEALFDACVRHADGHVAARTVLEVIAFWAMHRHFGPSPHHAVDDAVAERAVIDLVARGVLASPRASTTTAARSAARPARKDRP